MSDIEYVIAGTAVPVDKVTRPCEHLCPLASGQMYKWRCNVLWTKRQKKNGKTEYEAVRCPEDHDHSSNRAPSECPLRSGPLLIDPVIHVNREKQIPDRMLR